MLKNIKITTLVIASIISFNSYTANPGAVRFLITEGTKAVTNTLMLHKKKTVAAALATAGVAYVAIKKPVANPPSVTKSVEQLPTQKEISSILKTIDNVAGQMSKDNLPASGLIGIPLDYAKKLITKNTFITKCVTGVATLALLNYKVSAGYSAKNPRTICFAIN